MHPKVSLIMPVYNGEVFLRSSLDSLLAQNYSDFEIIIINDDSTDRSPEIMQEYADKDSRVKVFNNETNLGLTRSLNKAIRFSRGEYIARMDAGDTSESNRFTKQVTFLDGHQEYGLVGSWANIIDSNAKNIGSMSYKTTDEELRKVLIKYNPIVHSSIMMRKSILEQAGLYNEQWKYAQDYELYFQMIKHGKVAVLPEHLVSYRMSPGSITYKKNKEQTLFAIKARMKAIWEGQFSWWNIIFLWRPLLGYVLPYGWKNKMKDLL